MYSASRAHSPVHRLHSRPPTSYRRWLPSSRSLRLHPIFLIPIFLLGTLFSPFQSSTRRGTIQEPVYRKEDYDYSPEIAFAKPDAPPLVRERVGDEYGTGQGVGAGKKAEKVMARAGHGQGADEWEWWDPSTSSDSDSTSGTTSYSIYYERQGLLYFPTTPALISPLVPPPSYPLPKPKPPVLQRPLPLPQRQQHQQPPLNVRDPVPPHPPTDWLSPGDLFKSPLVRKASSPRRPPALNAPLPPPARPLRAPIGQRIPPAEREAAKRRIGANAQKAQKAKKEGKPFVPGKPAEVREAEMKWEKEQERKRVAKENERLRGVVWAEVKNEEDSRKVLGVDDDDDDDGDDDEEEEEGGDGEDLSDEAILEAVRGLSPEERKLLSKEEQTIIAELEEKYPRKRQQWKAVEEKKPVVGEPVQGKEGQKRKNFRDREGAPPPPPKREVKYAVKKPVFNPMAPQAAQMRKGGLRKRSFEAEPVDVDEGDETESSQFIRRALEEDGDAPSLSDSDRSKRGRQGPVDRIHPIQHLIEKAEGEWQEMLRRQSQTLEQAVEEYERRYGLKPPVGFDSWLIAFFSLRNQG